MTHDGISLEILSSLYLDLFNQLETEKEESEVSRGGSMQSQGTT
jgi:hypothetical protein